MDVAALQARLLPTQGQGGHAAAVTAILRDGDDGAEVLLVVRREREGDPWSGQVALPGGKALPDETCEETACREAREEVGIDLRASAPILGCLPMRAPANRPDMAVVPCVAVLTAEAALTAGEEIASCRWAPLRALAAGATTVRRTLRHGEREFPAFVHEGLEIWGLTHRILRELQEHIPP